jgi:asparagine synthase (glutamine-hydrolysing)
MANFLSPSKVNAFTIGFKESAFDETEYARLVAKKIGINHNVKILLIDDACKLISKIPYFMDEPMADPSILPTYLLSAFAREHVKVALSGDGGDESFVGYPKYLAHRFLEKYKFLKKPLSGFSCLVSGKIGAFMRYASYPLYLRNQLWISLFSPQDVNSLVLGAKSKYLFEDIERYHSLFDGKDILDEALFLDQSLTLPDMYLTKVDRASMANALEVRSPFLDHALLDYTCKIPFEKKIRGGVAKFLLKAMAAEVFPSSIVNRQKKGFGIPLSQWLKHDLKALCDELFEPGKITREGLLNPGVVKNCLSFGNIHQVWSLLVFELWYEDWMRN